MCDVLCADDMWCFFFFKQKTAYEMRISDWSSDVCSSRSGFNDAVGLAHEFLTREQQIVDMRLFEANDDRGDTCAKTDQDSRNNAEPGDLPEEPEKHPCSDRASSENGRHVRE